MSGGGRNLSSIVDGFQIAASRLLRLKMCSNPSQLGAIARPSLGKEGRGGKERCVADEVSAERRENSFLSSVGK